MKYLNLDLKHAESLDLRNIIRKLAAGLNPEIIFLLGFECESRVSETIFSIIPHWITKGNNYQLLVLIDRFRLFSAIKWTDLKHFELKDPSNTSITLMDIHVFNEAVKEGQAEANHIVNHAMIWYDSGRIQVPDPVISAFR